MLDERLKEQIEFSRKLHGHVGPYLVLGIRMGNAAEKALDIDDGDLSRLKVDVYIPLHIPNSCMLDGIQVATTCTIGNRRLRFRDSQTTKAFFLNEETSRTAKMTIKKSLETQLQEMEWQGRLDEGLALKIASMPHEELFEISIE